MPTMSRKDTNYDWFTSLQQCLMWNQRVSQKPFVVVESHKKQSRPSTEAAEPDSSSSEGSESVFAYVNEGNDSRKKDQDSQKDDDSQGFDLVPWTKEELDRATLSAVE